MNGLEFDEESSIALFAYVSCLAYLSPILGALLADGFLGRYLTILYFGVLYTVGMIVLTIGAFGTSYSTSVRRTLTLLGLFLVCIGTGGVKPCVSAFGADQVAHDSNKVPITQEQENTHESGLNNLDLASSESPQVAKDRVRAFFAYFYFCINVGAVVSIFSVPIIKANFGFGAAFCTPTVFLIFSMLLFSSKRKNYVHHVPSKDSPSLTDTFRLCGALLRHNLGSQYPSLSYTSNTHILLNTDENQNAENFSSGVRFSATGPINNGEAGMNALELDNYNRGSIFFSDVPPQQLADASQILHIMPIMFMLPVFWMLYDQQGSVWTLQAARMKLHGLQPEQVTLVNPVEIMIFIPLFDRFIYPVLQSRNWNITPLRRMGVGMVLTSVSFFTSGILETAIQVQEAEGGEKIDIFWQVPQITILAVAEILVSVTGLEFAYSVSPERLKALIMALYLLTTAVGDFLGGVCYSSIFQTLSRSTTMYVCSLLMLGNSIVFRFVAKWWEQREAEKKASV